LRLCGSARASFFDCKGFSNKKELNGYKFLLFGTLAFFSVSDFALEVPEIIKMSDIEEKPVLFQTVSTRPQSVTAVNAITPAWKSCAATAATGSIV